MLITLLFARPDWNSYDYPNSTQRQFSSMCRQFGGTRSQCKCNLDTATTKWTIKESFNEGLYYVQNQKLTDEAWKVHISCLPLEVL